MSFLHRTGWSTATLAGLVLLMCGGSWKPAWAALGGDITSVQNDAVHMKASIRTSVGAACTIHEITTGQTVIREYVSPQGKVFAVSWRGPFMPDLDQILGAYSQQFTQAMAARSQYRRIRGPAVLETPGLVVQSGGHMRAFVGRAYLPDSLPEGVDRRTIQ